MTDRRPSINIEILIYTVVFFLAALLRLSHLGAFPLSPDESRHALSAASVTRYASPHWNDGEYVTPQNPVYHNLTALVFTLFGAGEASARLIPALAGIALVFTPLLAKRRIGREYTLGVVVMFAITPVLITTSRTAGGPSVAALGIVSVLMLIAGADSEETIKRRLPWVAAGIGATLASGADALFGLMTVSLGALILFSRRSFFDTFSNAWKQYEVTRYAHITLIVLLVAVTGFGFSLRTIPGLGESLGHWFSGWFTHGELSGLTAISMIPVYEPMVLLLALVGMVTALRHENWMGLGAAVWGLASFILILVYPLRNAGDLLWVILPLAFLAAGQLVALINRRMKNQHWVEFYVLSSVLIFLIIFDFLLLQGYFKGVILIDGLSKVDIRLFPFVILGILVFAVLIVSLFALGWNTSLAIEASGSVIGTLLLLVTISAIWRLNFRPQAASAQELWRPQATTSSMYTLQSTIHSVSEMNTGREDSLAVHIPQATSRADVAWAMREFPIAVTDSTSSQPMALILVPEGGNISLPGEYIGQSFDLLERWDWYGVLPPMPLRWLVMRDTPIAQERWLLLVRADLIPGQAEMIADQVIE